jgi:hypothetical protein
MIKNAEIKHLYYSKIVVCVNGCVNLCQTNNKLKISHTCEYLEGMVIIDDRFEVKINCLKK